MILPNLWCKILYGPPLQYLLTRTCSYSVVSESVALVPCTVDIRQPCWQPSKLKDRLWSLSVREIPRTGWKRKTGIERESPISQSLQYQWFHPCSVVSPCFSSVPFVTFYLTLGSPHFSSFEWEIQTLFFFCGQPRARKAKMKWPKMVSFFSIAVIRFYGQTWRLFTSCGVVLLKEQTQWWHVWLMSTLCGST